MVLQKLTTKQVKELAKAKIGAAPEGVRWTSLVKEIAAESPDTPINTIWGSTRDLFKNDVEIVKVTKGIYAVGSPSGTVSADDFSIEKPEISVSTTGVSFSESDFYQPFADWLRALDEVTEAIPVGGNIFKGKWNTPDVIGVLRPLKGDLIRFDPQIISAEIKIDPSQPVIAFGQATSYRLFSHKCYLVLPRGMSEDDLDRIEALSVVFGLGLVLFDVNADDPKFQLVVRAILAQPDMVYVNQMAHRLNAYDSKAFDRLF